MILRKNHRVLVQGITGRQGSFWTGLMQDYGTKVVAGINPKKAGTRHLGVPRDRLVSSAISMTSFRIVELRFSPKA